MENENKDHIEDDNQNKYYPTGTIYGDVLFIRTKSNELAQRARKYIERNLGNANFESEEYRYLTPAGKDTRKVFRGGIVTGFIIGFFAALVAVAIYADIVIL